MTLRFRAGIELNGINPYVRVRADQAAKLKSNSRRPMPVRVKIDGKPDAPWRVNLMPVGDGDFYLYLHGSVRKASATSVATWSASRLGFDDEYTGGPGPSHARLVWRRIGT